jgi:hypothetical protein
VTWCPSICDRANPSCSLGARKAAPDSSCCCCFLFSDPAAPIGLAENCDAAHRLYLGMRLSSPLPQPAGDWGASELFRSAGEKLKKQTNSTEAVWHEIQFIQPTKPKTLFRLDLCTVKQKMRPSRTDNHRVYGGIMHAQHQRSHGANDHQKPPGHSGSRYQRSYDSTYSQ